MRKLSIIVTLVLAAWTSPAYGSVMLSESSQGKTANVSLKSTFSLTLHSTYWSLGPLPTGVSLIGAATISPIMPGPNAPTGCKIAGSGCGTITWKFVASSKGVKTIVASRQSCGEALRCTPAQGSYRVQIKVS